MMKKPRNLKSQLTFQQFLHPWVHVAEDEAVQLSNMQGHIFHVTVQHCLPHLQQTVEHVMWYLHIKLINEFIIIAVTCQIAI
jgi:hypothetical protein